MASQVFHQLCYHFVWATQDRAPLFVGVAQERMLEDVRESCNNREMEVLACNVMPDHIHLLVTLPPTISVDTFIKQVKGATSLAHNHRFGTRQYLKWQDSYGVITIRQADTEKAIRYIENQQQLHEDRKTSRLLETTEQIDTEQTGTTDDS